MTLLDGLALSARIKEELKEENKNLKDKGIHPTLAVILVGNNLASQSYVNSKAKACEECGIKSLIYHLDEGIEENELLELINDLNDNDHIHGILVQLPLPRHIDKNLILESIVSTKDVDGFHPINVGYLNLGLQSGFLPCTPLGIMKLLKAYDIVLEGLDSVIIGASNIVGRPMASMLLNAGSTVSICHIKTRDLSLYTKKADLIIVAVGSVNLLQEYMIKRGAIVIDVGINRLKNGKIIGDVNFKEVSKKASFITPVPGGVGPMTIAMLLQNTLKSAKNKLN